ncbi:hypothetical protein GW17_00004814 [Ensete ventricosum]|nr:hypothetical protein GW17_00004814 [Ensete ventricosum]
MLRLGMIREWSHGRTLSYKGIIGVLGELDNPSTHIRLSELDNSEDKTKCKTTNSSVMGLVTLWYPRDKTSVESSLPCSYGGRALVVKGAEEVENTEINSNITTILKGKG